MPASFRFARIRAYLGAVLAVALATVLTALMRTLLTPSVSLLYFPAIVVSAIYGGYGPALLATVLSTVSLAYFFVAPLYSLSIGVDDGLRLSVFTLVACATAWLSARRRRAEQRERQSLEELQGVVDTLRKVNDWPVSIDAAGVPRMLQHASHVAAAATVVAIWEPEDEPDVYRGTNAAGDPVTKHAPGELTPAGAQFVEPFQTANLTGRVFFSGIENPNPEVAHVVQLVAREVGNSLDQLYLVEKLRRVAVKQERIRVSRDLHDGVLQALTGIRLELQSIAQDTMSPDTFADRLLAIERAIAIEQRELRLLIQDLKPAQAPAHPPGPVVQRLERMCAQLGSEWQTPITVRVSPADVVLPPGVEEETRLMVHEAVVNALKHAHPSRVSVGLDAGDAGLTVVVTDDGRGFPFQGRFDLETLQRHNAGPVSLRERVSALNGRLTIESTGKGSRLEFQFPFSSP